MVLTGLISGCGGGGGDAPPVNNTPPPATYTLGGTVSGLAGAGLVLRNGTTDLPINTSGSFAFAGGLASGSAYAVSVLVQPGSPAQTCEVANGSGTIASANVANIAVTCTTQPLSLSSSTPNAGATGFDRNGNITLVFSAALDPASVTGNLALQSAAGPVPVSAQASGSTVTIDPQAKLRMLTDYTLNVATGLRGAHGESLASSVSVQFRSADGTWQTPRLLETENLGHALKPQIALNARGDAVVVWQQTNASSTNIWAIGFTPSSGWGSLAHIEPNAPNGFEPRVAIDSNGNANAVWSAGSAQKMRIWANRLTAGSGWGVAEAIDLSSSLVGSSAQPQIALNPDGNGMAVWFTADDEGDPALAQTDIWFSRYERNAGWGVPAIGATTKPTSDIDAVAPDIAVDANANALVVWSAVSSHQDLNAVGRIHASYGALSGMWFHEPLDASTAPASAFPKIAVDGNGNAIAVWERDDGNGITSIWAARYEIDGGWGAAQLIESDSANRAKEAQIAVAPSGEAIAVWLQFVGARRELWSNRYRPEVGWGTPELVGTNTGTASAPQIAIEADGRALAISVAVTGTTRNVVANRYVPGEGWSAPMRVNGSDTEVVITPQIKIDSSGAAIAVWPQMSEGRYDIWANRFE